MESPSINPTGEDEIQPETEVETSLESADYPDETDNMADFFELRKTLFILISVLSLVIFFAVWPAFGLNIALNYLLGAVVGLIYVRMLAKDVETMGADTNQLLGKVRLLLFVAVAAIASKLDSLEVLPIFLGFLTYKIALVLYTLREFIRPSS